MKKTMAAVVAAAGALALSAGGAQAQFYISGSAGLLMPEDISASAAGTTIKAELDNGPALNFALGYKFTMGLRTEVEAGWARTKITGFSGPGGSVSASGGDNNVWSGTVNAFYDFNTGTSLTPYLGGGIGAANIESSTITVGGVTGRTGSSTDFAWMLEGGVAIAVAPNLSIVPAYRYFRINSGSSSGGVSVDDTSAHIIKVGLRLTF
jgi:OmpA-OmpF porin, OOP family